MNLNTLPKLLPQPLRSICRNALDIKNQNFTRGTREEKVKAISKDCFRLLLAMALGSLIWFRPAPVLSRIHWDRFRTIIFLGIFAISPSSSMLLGAGCLAYLSGTSLRCAYAKKSLADLGGAIFTGMIANLLSENYKYYEKKYIGEDILIRLIEW